jgi:hypothetical protein
MAGASRWIAAAFSLALGAATAAQAESLSAGARGDALEARIAKLEAQLEAANHKADLALDRGEVENVFSNYMFLHNSFQDEQIKSLWAKRGTPGMSAQYSNLGVYTQYDSIMAYHSGRPNPVGKLIQHYATNPSIQIAADRQTAKGYGSWRAWSPASARRRRRLRTRFPVRKGGHGRQRGARQEGLGTLGTDQIRRRFHPPG